MTVELYLYVGMNYGSMAPQRSYAGVPGRIVQPLEPVEDKEKQPTEGILGLWYNILT